MALAACAPGNPVPMQAEVTAWGGYYPVAPLPRSTLSGATTVEALYKAALALPPAPAAARSCPPDYGLEYDVEIVLHAASGTGATGTAAHETNGPTGASGPTGALLTARLDADGCQGIRLQPGGARDGLSPQGQRFRALLASAVGLPSPSDLSGAPTPGAPPTLYPPGGIPDATPPTVATLIAGRGPAGLHGVSAAAWAGLRAVGSTFGDPDPSLRFLTANASRRDGRIMYHVVLAGHFARAGRPATLLTFDLWGDGSGAWSLEAALARRIVWRLYLLSVEPGRLAP